jgi:osmotically-inducible protein OsmY
MDNDRRIQKDVEDELGWDPSIDEAGIGVAVESGIVSLSGRVRNFVERYRAERAVLRVRGVRGVANDLDVQVAPRPGRTDAQIAAAAATALGLSITIPKDQVKVVVRDGTLTLDGTVEWEYQRKAAARWVRDLEGVKQVINRVTLRPKATAKDVQRKITAAFHRRAQLDAESLQVDVDDTRVTLRGKVSSFEEKRRAEQTAWSAPDITDVRNLLEVQSRVPTAAF